MLLEGVRGEYASWKLSFPLTGVKETCLGCGGEGVEEGVVPVALVDVLDNEEGDEES